MCVQCGRLIHCKYKLVKHTTEEKRNLLKETISWLNETFIPLFGMIPLEDLPRAYRMNGTACVIAKALQDNVPNTGKTWQVSTENIYRYTPRELREEDYDDVPSVEEMDREQIKIDDWELPENVREFVRLFDMGEYPEFIAEALAPQEVYHDSRI